MHRTSTQAMVSPAAAAASVAPLADPPPKRRRLGYACDLCRVKKNRCDGERPSCGTCKVRRQECVYSPQRSRVSVTQEYVDDLRTQNQMLEQQLAAQQRQNSNSRSLPPVFVSEGNVPPIPSSRPPRATPQVLPASMGVQRFVSPQAGAQGSPQSSRQSHRQQTFAIWVPIVQSSEPSNSTRQAAETHRAAKDSNPDATDGSPGNSTEYFGESSTFDFMNKVQVCSPDTEASKGAPTARPRHYQSRNVSLAASAPSTPIFESLLLGSGTEDPFGLPHRVVADHLVDAYFEFRHPTNTHMHEESFRQRYRRLWLSEIQGGEAATEENLAWLGLVNMVFAFGSSHAQPAGHNSSVERSRFFKRAKTLVFSGLLQTGSIELVQALLLMGQYLHGSLELNNCWTVVGLAIRKAQGLGLHLDAQGFTSDIIEQEVRKRVWWGCFVIDRVLSIKVGRPPTIQDGPAIKVGLPLAIDDEYLSNNDQNPPTQPAGVPSKLEFINQVIAECRLIARILETLYSGGNIDTTETSKQRPSMDVPELLALSVQLDGELVAWQQGLPPHLRNESQVDGWHFERQRSILTMRDSWAEVRLDSYTPVNSSIGKHFLMCVMRRATDHFQQEIMYCCVRRCVTAAHDSISQMQHLHQQNLLQSWWHNSHYVFAALGVLLAFQTLDPQSKAEVGIFNSDDIEATIRGGLDLLEKVGGQMHPIANRYVQAFRQLREKLRVFSSSSVRGMYSNGGTTMRPPPNDQTSSIGLDPEGGPEVNGGRGENAGPTAAYSYIGETNEISRATSREASIMVGFENEFANIENMLLDSTGWTGLMDDWSNSFG